MDKSYTMEKFQYTINHIRQLKEQFTKSTCELQECFEHMLKAELESGRHNCTLSVSVYPELYAKALLNMGFKVEEVKKVASVRAYKISWDSLI